MRSRVWVASVSLQAALTGVGLALVGATPRALLPVGFRVEELAPYLVMQICLGAVGALLATQRPRNPIGWLLLATAAASALQIAIVGYALYGLLGPGGPGADVAAWIFNWIGVAIAGLLTPMVFLFPDGTIRPRIGRAAVVTTALGLTSLAAVLAFRPGPLSVLGTIENPFGIAAPGQTWDGVMLIGLLFTFITVGLAIVQLRERARSGSAVERQQLKWFLWSAVVFGVTMAFASPFIFGAPDAVGGQGAIRYVARLASALSLSTLPIAIGIAILRYRLYDIDLLINRTVVYVSVTAILATAFAVLSTAAQRTVETITGQRSELVTVVLVLSVAVGFAPLRRRIQPLVDRVLPGRGLLTLLFTDIAGSTERIVALGDERWRRVLDEYRGTVRRELARFGGREIDTAGDGFFATFDRPARAVQCAAALRTALRTMGLDSRIGLHMGECELRGESVSGLNVHVAARIMATAQANEIVTSSALRDPVEDAGFRFRETGTERPLKGVPGVWRLGFVDDAPMPA